jgi:DNA excision repair protein ERCC-2
LEEEYRKLLDGLRETGDHDEEDDFLANPGKSNFLFESLVCDPKLRQDLLLMIVMPANLVDEAIPGNIRRAEHFTAFLARFVEYLKVPQSPICLLWFIH